MAKEWTCLYCNSRNPLNTRFCLTCSAGFLDMARQYSQSREQETIFNWAVGGVSSRVRQDYSGEIPGPGDLIGGLFHLVQAVEDEKISREQYKTVLQEMLPRLEAVLEQVVADLAPSSEEAGDYTAMVREVLRSVLYMLSIGIEEMARFAGDRNTDHLFNGLRLAQKAEMDYIDLAKTLYTDSHMNPFAGRKDVLNDLASQVIDRRMDVGTFHSQVTSLKQSLDRMIRESRDLLNEGYRKTMTFDGVNESILFSARDDFKQAGEQLAGVIINLHNMEDTRRAVREVVEKVAKTTKKDQGENLCL